MPNSVIPQVGIFSFEMKLWFRRRVRKAMPASRSEHIQTSAIPLPDPAKPPGNRGSWEQAALTNVEITELVKQQIGSVNMPWNK